MIHKKNLYYGLYATLFLYVIYFIYTCDIIFAYIYTIQYTELIYIYIYSSYTYTHRRVTRECRAYIHIYYIARIYGVAQKLGLYSI